MDRASKEKRDSTKREYIYKNNVCGREGGIKKKEVLCEAAAVNKPAWLSDWLQNSLTVDSTQKNQRFSHILWKIELKVAFIFISKQKGRNELKYVADDSKCN